MFQHQPGVLLAGVVGSQAYGLATPESDTDRLGIFAVPTELLFGLSLPEPSRVFKEPDVTYHEAARACRLLSTCNPTVTELLWLPEHEVKTDLGQELVDIRTSFLWKQKVRNAYLGYAEAQFDRMYRRPDKTFSSDLRKRTAKHARHLLRLLHQGFDLYRTGQLVVKLEDPQMYHDFGDNVAEEPDRAKVQLDLYRRQFDEAQSPLPDGPDLVMIEEWLVKVRRANL